MTQILTWNGNSLQTATFTANFEAGDEPFAIDSEIATSAPMSGRPQVTSFRHLPRTLVVHIRIKSGGFREGAELLSQWFANGTEGTLRVDPGDGSVRVINGIVKTIRPYADGQAMRYEAVIYCADGRWRADTESSHAASVSASPHNFAIANLGNIDCDELMLTYQPTALKTQANGQRYFRDIIIANRTPNEFQDEPIELTGGQLHMSDKFYDVGGVPAFLTVDDHSTTSMGNIDFTLSGWVRLRSKNYKQAIVGKWSVTGSQFEYLLDYDNVADRFRFLVSNNGTAIAITQDSVVGSPVIGKWYYLVGRHNAATDQVTLNINANASTNVITHTTGVFNGTSPFRVGSEGNGANPLFGEVAGVGIWKRVISFAEIQQMYNGGVSVYPSGTLTDYAQYWPLQEETGLRGSLTGTLWLTPSGRIYKGGGPSGFDHAALVAAGKSQADGDDLRVYVDGQEVPRWLGRHADTDANSTMTRIWANLHLAPMRTAVTWTTAGSNNPATGGTLIVKEGTTSGWPERGAILWHNECILYDGKTDNAFLNVTRGARGTVAAAHGAGTVMYWVEHRIQLAYGDTSIGTPVSRTDLEPIIDLTNAYCDNYRHIWTRFTDAANPARSGQWLYDLIDRDARFDEVFSLTQGANELYWMYKYGKWGAAGQEDKNLVNWNVARKHFPQGLFGWHEYRRYMENTFALKGIAILADGGEREVDDIYTPSSVVTSTAAFIDMVSYDWMWYARSKFVYSTPENKDYPLIDRATFSTPIIVAPTGSARAWGYKIKNTSNEVKSIRGCDFLVIFGDASKTDVTFYMAPVKADGLYDINAGVNKVVPAASIGTPGAPKWVSVEWDDPFTWFPGQEMWLIVSGGGAGASQLSWSVQPVAMEAGRQVNATTATLVDQNYPTPGFRVWGDGPVDNWVHGEHDDVLYINYAHFDMYHSPFTQMGPEQAAYVADFRWENLDSGEYIEVDNLLLPGDGTTVLTLDHATRKATTNEEYGRDVTSVVKVPAGQRTWPKARSGADDFRLTETGIPGVDLDVTWRSMWL